MDSFVCDKCGKKFTAKTNLTRHEKTHTKENFTCGQCDGKYNTKRALQEHDTRVHSSVLYPCEQCKKSFTCKSSLKKLIVAKENFPFNNDNYDYKYMC